MTRASWMSPEEGAHQSRQTLIWLYHLSDNSRLMEKENSKSGWHYIIIQKEDAVDQEI